MKRRMNGEQRKMTKRMMTTRTSKLMKRKKWKGVMTTRTKKSMKMKKWKGTMTRMKFLQKDCNLKRRKYSRRNSMKQLPCRRGWLSESPSGAP